MRKLTLLAALLTGAALPVNAQVVVDMSLITCQQYQEIADSNPDRAIIIASWMGGYFSASKNLTTIDLRYTERNTEKVQAYCKSHRSESLMSAIEKNYR